MRVLFLAQRTGFPEGRIPPNGSGAHVAATLAGLRDHFEVLPMMAEPSVVAATQPRSRYGRLVPGRVRGVRLDLGFATADRAFEQRALRESEAFGPSIVYERSEYLALAGVRVARALRVPLVLEVNGLLEDDARRLYRSLAEPIGAAVERRKQRSADAIVVESPGMALALERRGVPSGRMAVVPNAVPPWKLAAEPRRPSSAPVVIGWIGHLMPWYLDSIEFLLLAVPLVRREVPGVRFQVVAGGPGLDGLRARAHQLGVSDSVTFREAVEYERVPAVLAEFDVGVIPSAFDYQFPVKLVEMGAAGLALVAPRTTSIDGLLARGSEYEDFAPGEIEGLAAALIRVASDADRRERLARSIHDAVSQRFIWPVTGRALADAVLAAVAEGRPAGS